MANGDVRNPPTVFGLVIRSKWLGLRAILNALRSLNAQCQSSAEIEGRTPILALARELEWIEGVAMLESDDFMRREDADTA